MDNFLTPISTVKKVQSNIEKFETLSLREHGPPRSSSNKSKRSIFEITESKEEPTPTLQAHVESSVTLVEARKPSNATQAKKHKRHDSTAFLQHSYLQQSGPASLPDDAREILKSQPDRQDLEAVLEYLNYGIEGKHDFNIRIAGPKAAQIINVIATVTIPDQWHNLRAARLSESEAKIKKAILSCLTSIAGIGALLAQMKKLATIQHQVEDDSLLKDTVNVLSHILNKSQTVTNFLQDATRLYASDVQRRLFWQEITSLLAGSKILNTASHTMAGKSVGPEIWLSDGTQYSRWLSRNISVAVTRLTTSEAESWKMLGQVLKRALNLGYRGRF